MNKELILLPVVAMVVLTATVWCRLYVVRIREMRARRIRAQDLASRGAGTTLLANTGPADNFMNLFEMPVLFYVLMVLLYVTNLGDSLYLSLASSFVALRCAHSAIHVTYNRVMHRFLAYAASSAVLWIMWARFAFHLVTHNGL